MTLEKLKYVLHYKFNNSANDKGFNLRFNNSYELVVDTDKRSVTLLDHNSYARTEIILKNGSFILDKLMTTSLGVVIDYIDLDLNDVVFNNIDEEVDMAIEHIVRYGSTATIANRYTITETEDNCYRVANTDDIGMTFRSLDRAKEYILERF